ncbi:MAG: hypothetical protein E6I84_05710 [Chloroflexi bacterium]|nr:MAG: hypothetical protein E6I84_05710 [Chloroflexota bacterium]
MTSEGQRLEALAERLRGVDPMMPSPAAKIRGWNLVSAAVQQSATVHSRRHSVKRLILAAVAAAVLLVAGAVAASADSLPDSALYPLKGVVEQARAAFAFTPADRLTYRLDLARTRLTEAEAMIARHRVDLAGEALNAMNDQLNAAAALVESEKGSDPALATDLENRLVQAIATHDRQLAGLQGQVTNPVAQNAISQARNRAAQTAQAAKAAGTSGNPNPNGKGQGSGPASPHPTPKP